MWRRLLIGAGYGVIGLIVAIGLTFSAYAVAGRDLAEPATPLGAGSALAPGHASTGTPAATEHQQRRIARSEHRRAVHDLRVARRTGAAPGNTGAGGDSGGASASASTEGGGGSGDGATGTGGGGSGEPGPGITSGGGDGGGSGGSGSTDGHDDGASGGGGSGGSGDGGGDD